MSVFDSKQFEVKLQGHAIAKWLGKKDAATLAQLFSLCLKEKWRGRLEINFPGNGGVTDVVFTEVRRMTETKEDLLYEGL